jgi:hypothetical protein
MPMIANPACHEKSKKEKGRWDSIGLSQLVRPERFELPTPKFVAWCSIQLSYGRRTGIMRCPCKFRQRKHLYHSPKPLANSSNGGD